MKNWYVEYKDGNRSKVRAERVAIKGDWILFYNRPRKTSTAIVLVGSYAVAEVRGFGVEMAK